MTDPMTPTDPATTRELRDALVSDLMWNGIKTQADLTDRLDALIARAADEARAGLVGVVWSRPGCVKVTDGNVCAQPEGTFYHHTHDDGGLPHGAACHQYVPGTIAALAATPPTPAVER